MEAGTGRDGGKEEGKGRREGEKRRPWKEGREREPESTKPLF